MTKRILIFIIASMALAAVAEGQRKVNVRFAMGTSSAKLTGSVKGYNYTDYILSARAQQTMTVRLRSPSQFAQFVVFDKNMDNLEGSTGETEWSGELPTAGKYTVRVLLPRSEARRRGSMATYTITVSIQ